MTDTPERKTNTGRHVPNWASYPSTSFRSKFGGAFTKIINDRNLAELIQRDPAARKLVTKPAKDALKKPPVIMSDDAAWAEKANAMIEHMDYHTSLKYAYMSARGFGYGLVLLGVAAPEGLDLAPGKVSGIESSTSLWKTQVDKYEICEDPHDLQYYGQIKDYTIKMSINGQMVKRRIHASRVQHVVHDPEGNSPNGVPILQPLWNTFQGKEKMDFSLAHAVYRYSSPLSTMELPQDADTEEFQDASKMFYLDGRNEFCVPYGYTVKLHSPGGSLNPQPFVDYCWENICAGSEFNKVSLLGADAGAITGSWVNQASYFGDIAAIQSTELEIHYVDLLDRAIAWGVLPEPSAPYWIDWPKLWEMDQKELAETKRAMAAATLLEAQALEKYLAIQAGGAPIKMGFDAQGWYIEPTDQAGATKSYLFQHNTHRPHMKAPDTRHVARKVNRGKDQADRLWQKWGYRTDAIEREHKALQDIGYTEIEKHLQAQTRKLILKAMPDYEAPRPDPRKEKPEVLQSINTATTEAARAVRKGLAIPKKLSMVREYNAMMLDGDKYGWEVTRSIMRGASFINADYDWMLSDDAAQAYLERSELLWETRNGDIITAAKYGIMEGINQGESMQQIYDRISETITKVARPAVFVATEVHRAAEAGRLDLYKKAGVEMVEWLTAGDEKVRTEHEARDGRVFPIDEALELMSEPNCRCTYLPVIEGVPT